MNLSISVFCSLQCYLAQEMPKKNVFTVFIDPIVTIDGFPNHVAKSNHSISHYKPRTSSLQDCIPSLEQCVGRLA